MLQDNHNNNIHNHNNNSDTRKQLFQVLSDIRRDLENGNVVNTNQSSSRVVRGGVVLCDGGDRINSKENVVCNSRTTTKQQLNKTRVDARRNAIRLKSLREQQKETDRRDCVEEMKALVAQKYQQTQAVQELERIKQQDQIRQKEGIKLAKLHYRFSLLLNVFNLWKSSLEDQYLAIKKVTLYYRDKLTTESFATWAVFVRNHRSKQRDYAQQIYSRMLLNRFLRSWIFYSTNINESIAKKRSRTAFRYLKKAIFLERQRDLEINLQSFCKGKKSLLSHYFALWSTMCLELKERQLFENQVNEKFHEIHSWLDAQKEDEIHSECINSGKQFCCSPWDL